MLKKLGKIKQNDALLDDQETAEANVYELHKLFDERYDFYHSWAIFFHDSMMQKDPRTHPRTIARLIGTIAQAEEEIIRLLNSKGIPPDSARAERLRLLIGLLAVQNGKKQ